MKVCRSKWPEFDQVRRDFARKLSATCRTVESCKWNLVDLCVILCMRWLSILALSEYVGPSYFDYHTKRNSSTMLNAHCMRVKNSKSQCVRRLDAYLYITHCQESKAELIHRP